MEGTYDKKADAVQLYLVPRGSERNFARTEEKEKGIMYDYDKQGKIIGIEFLDASERLPSSFLETLTRI